MAKDAAMFSSAEQGHSNARCYLWNGPWVTLGRFQIPEQALKASCRLPWSMRPTGGLGVLHGHDLTFALALPNGARSLQTIYRRLAGPIIAAFHEIGVPATLGETIRAGSSKGASDCFSSVAPNDIIDAFTGLKICGCAMRASRSAVLLQASIPLQSPLIDPREIFTGPALTSTVLDHRADFRQALIFHTERFLADLYAKPDSLDEEIVEAIKT